MNYNSNMLYPHSEIHDLIEHEKMHYKYIALRTYFTNLANHYHLMTQLLTHDNSHQTESFKTCDNSCCKEYVKALELTAI